MSPILCLNDKKVKRSNHRYNLIQGLLDESVYLLKSATCSMHMDLDVRDIKIKLLFIHLTLIDINLYSIIPHFPS